MSTRHHRVDRWLDEFAYETACDQGSVFVLLVRENPFQTNPKHPRECINFFHILRAISVLHVQVPRVHLNKTRQRTERFLKIYDRLLFVVQGREDLVYSKYTGVERTPLVNPLDIALIDIHRLRLQRRISRWRNLLLKPWDLSSAQVSFRWLYA